MTAQGTLPRFPRGRVSQRLLDCLQQNSKFLEQNMDAHYIVTELYSNLILDDDDKDRILGLETCRNTPLNQNQRLISRITMKTDQGFKAFVQALDATGHKLCASRIREWLNRNTGDFEGRGASSEVDIVHQGSRAELVDSAAVGQESVIGQLRGRVGHVETRLDVLSLRVTNLASSSSDHQETEAEQLRAQLAESREEIENLKQLLAYKSQDLAKAQEEIDTLQQRIVKLNEEQRALEDKLSAQERKLKEQESKMKNQESRLKEHELKVKGQESKLKEQDSRIKSQENKLQSAESKISNLTEEMKKERQQHKKDVELCTRMCREMASRLENNERTMRDFLARSQQPEGQGQGQGQSQATDGRTARQNVQAKPAAKVCVQVSKQPAPSREQEKNQSAARQVRLAPDKTINNKKSSTNKK